MIFSETLGVSENQMDPLLQSTGFPCRTVYQIQDHFQELQLCYSEVRFNPYKF